MDLSTKNQCRTSFKIAGAFDPDVISDILHLTPERQWKIGDCRANGTQFDFALWEIGVCTEYEAITDRQMRKTVAPLTDKVAELQKIRSEFDVSFTLEIVPTLYVGEQTPCLAPSLDIMDFCHETRTELDIDLYLYGEND